MHTHPGSCHCGKLTLAYESEEPAGRLATRRCGCSFCRRHGGRYTSDPAGRVTLTVEDEESLVRYRFGHKTADFLMCAACGVFMAAYMELDGKGYAVVNVNTFDDAGAFPLADQTFDYDAESEADRFRAILDSMTLPPWRYGVAELVALAAALPRRGAHEFQRHECQRRQC